MSILETITPVTKRVFFLSLSLLIDLSRSPHYVQFVLGKKKNVNMQLNSTGLYKPFTILQVIFCSHENDFNMV